MKKIFLIFSVVLYFQDANAEGTCGVSLSCEGMAKCNAVLAECRIESKRSKIDSCILKIRESCADDEEIAGDSSRPGEREKVTVVIAELKENKLKMPYDPLFDSPLAKELAEKQTQCIQHGKWVYKIGDKSSKAKKFGKTYSKEFDDNTTCEAARLNDDKNTVSGSTCYFRYLGKTQKAKLVRADFMYRDRDTNTSYGGTPLKDKVFFSSQEKCEAAVKDGLHHSTFIPPIEIHGIASKEEPRFIKSCYEEEITICFENQSSVEAAEPEIVK